MLSRIADSIFWIGRYMERADNTARILDVNYHMLLEQPPDTYKLRWDPLITITGERSALLSEIRAKRVRRRLSSSSVSPKTIRTPSASALSRRARTRAPFATAFRANYGKTSTAFITKSTSCAITAKTCHASATPCRRGGHRFHGVCDATLARDEGWHFVQAGCALERAEMTARILDVHYHQLLEGSELLNEARSHAVDGGAEIGGGV